MALLTLTIGCSPTVNLSGHLPDADRLAEIKPGVSTRNDVRQIMGSPSNLSTFDSSTWYYVSRRTEQFAFYEPKVLEQTVITVQFDPQGRVAEVSKLGLEQARELELVERITPTRGKKLGFVEQVFGNIGRFTEKGTAGPQRGH